MHPILVYVDSLSWGIIPDTRFRFRSDQIKMGPTNLGVIFLMQGRWLPPAGSMVFTSMKISILRSVRRWR
jgi:hypothetical protein